MGVFKNDVGRPTNETIKKRRILKSILALLVAGALFTGGYYVNEFISKYDVNKEKENESKKEEVSLDEAEKIMTRVFGENYSGDFIWYFETSINEEKYKMNWAISNTKKIENKYTCKKMYGNNIVDDKYLINNKYFIDSAACDESFYSYEDANKIYQSYFGNKGNLKKETLVFTEEQLYSYEYFEKENIYSRVSYSVGLGDMIGVGKTVSAYKQAGKMYITVSFGYSGYSSEKEEYELWLNDGTKIIANQKEINNNETFIKYKDKLEKYEFIFFEEDGLYKFEKVDKISKEVAENKDSKELDINSEEVMDLYIPFSYFMHEASGEELYKKDKVTQADLSVEYKNRLAFAKLYNSVSYDNLFTDKIEISKEDGLYVSGFKSEVLEKYYKKLFGKNAKYVAKTFDSYSINTLYMYYDEKTDTYSEDLAGGDWTSFRYGNEIYKAIEADNKIELYLYVVVFNSDSENKGGVYRNIEDATNFKNAIKEVKTYDEFVYLMKYKDKKISYEGIYFDDLSDYKDEASQYKITFVKEDNNYIFESVEKIK